MELRAKKSLGQHFLKSEKALSDIIDAAALHAGETVLEIGPGTGILTERLLATGARVIAIEKDPRSCALVRERFASAVTTEKLMLIEGDVLDLDRAALGLEEGKYALVANIPYYITGAILEMFLEHAPRPSRMMLLVQKEVAERAVARAEGGTGGREAKESILSVSVKAFGEPRIVSTVPRGAFVPPPDVDSAILAIESISDRRFRENNVEIKHFFEIVKAGFAHKRKFLARNLEEVMSRETIEKAWQETGLEKDVRAEDLNIEKWLNIAAYRG